MQYTVNYPTLHEPGEAGIAVGHMIARNFGWPTEGTDTLKCTRLALAPDGCGWDAYYTVVESTTQIGCEPQPWPGVGRVLPDEGNKMNTEQVVDRFSNLSEGERMLVTIEMLRDYIEGMLPRLDGELASDAEDALTYSCGWRPKIEALDLPAPGSSRWALTKRSARKREALE